MGQNRLKWYDDWFDSPYYHILYAQRDDNEAFSFINNFLLWLSPKRPSRFLDLACGNGRHAKFLAKDGHYVYGADLSENNILQAKQIQLPHVHFFVHDMKCQLPINALDGIFNFFTSFGYFDTVDENRKTIRNIYHALSNNGFLLLDYLNPANIRKNLVPKESRHINGITFDIRRYEKEGKFIKDIHIVDGSYQFDFQEKVSAFTKENLCTLMEQEGLTVVQSFGDYSLNEFDVNQSPRCILFAKKVI